MDSANSPKLEPGSNVDAQLAKNPLSFLKYHFSNIIPDAKQIIDDFGIKVFPTSMIIDTKGCIHPLHIGVVEADANIGNEEEMYYVKIKKILSKFSQ